MPWYILKQPDGLFAAFSSVTDAFCMWDATVVEALDYCREHMGRADACAKVRRGQDDEPLENLGEAPAADGLNRWRASLRTIALLRGAAALRASLACISGMTDAERERWAREAIAALPAGAVEL
jgi:hypothetical protein